MTVHRPGVDSCWWSKPSGRRRGRTGNLTRGGGRFVPYVVGGLATWTLGYLVDWRRLADLLTTEPSVLFVRVVLPVFEAPIRRGFAFSHILMLTVSGSAASIAATVAAYQRIEVLMWQTVSKLLVCVGRFFGGTFVAQTAQRLPNPYDGCQRLAEAVRPAEMQEEGGG